MFSIPCLHTFSTLQIERDTNGMLQCHPHPNEYIDASKNGSNCSLFMGLQRKKGVIVEDRQKFDVSRAVDEFRHSVNSYSFMKSGMNIRLTHICRRQIPRYVFPIGYKQRRLDLKRKKDADDEDTKPNTPAKQDSIKRKDDA